MASNRNQKMLLFDLEFVLGSVRSHSLISGYAECINQHNQKQFWKKKNKWNEKGHSVIVIWMKKTICLRSFARFRPETVTLVPILVQDSERARPATQSRWRPTTICYKNERGRTEQEKWKKELRFAIWFESKVSFECACFPLCCRHLTATKSCSNPQHVAVVVERCWMLLQWWWSLLLGWALCWAVFHKKQTLAHIQLRCTEVIRPKKGQFTFNSDSLSTMSFFIGAKFGVHLNRPFPVL